MDAVVIMSSGGLCSAVAAWRARGAGALHLVHFDWGHRSAAVRRRSVMELAKHLKPAGATSLHLPHVAHIARGPVEATAEQNAPGLPGTLAEAPAGLMTTLLTAAVQYALRIGARTIVYGGSQAGNEADVQAPPGEGTRDRRREFFFYYNAMLDSALPARQRVQVQTPLIDLTRADIARLGQRYGVPFALTWSCLESGPQPCGSCPGCRARAQALLEAGVREGTLPGGGRAAVAGAKAAPATVGAAR